MKRSDCGKEPSVATKEPRLEVDKSPACSSSAIQQPQEGDSCQPSSSVKKALRRSLQLKHQRTVIQAAFQDASTRKTGESEKQLQEWSKVVSGAGYFCEVRFLMSDLSPFPHFWWNMNLVSPWLFTTPSTLCSIQVMVPFRLFDWLFLQMESGDWIARYLNNV